MGDLLLVLLVGLTQPVQFFPLLPKKIPSSPGLLQQVPIVFFKKLVSILNDGDISISAAQRGGGLGPLERFGSCGGIGDAGG